VHIQEPKTIPSASHLNLLFKQAETRALNGETDAQEMGLPVRLSHPGPTKSLRMRD